MDSSSIEMDANFFERIARSVRMDGNLFELIAWAIWTAYEGYPFKNG